MRLIPALLSSFALLACGKVIPLEPGQDGDGGPDGGVENDSGSGSGSDSGSADPDAAVVTSPFDFAVTTTKRPVLVGTSEPIAVSITRHAPFTGAVVVTATNLPVGVTATQLTLAAGETSGALTISSDGSAAHTLPTQITLTAVADSVEKSAIATVTVHGPTGSLDSGFGTKLLEVADGDDYADAMAVQADGKIVLAGTTVDAGGSNANFALVRLDRNGVRDLAFGNVVTDIGGGFDTAHGIALQPDGKIVVVGSAVINGSGADFAITRYLADGSLDPTFSGDGKVTTALGTDSDVAYAVAIQPDGKIVVAGSSQRGFATTGVDFAVVRYNADGSLDGSFDTDGIVTTPIAASNNADVAYAVALQQIAGETRIVVAGGESNFQLARYRPNGALDTTFGTSGKVATVFAAYTGGAARALVLTPDNDMFVAGYVAESWEHTFAVAKLTAGGQPDSQFGPAVVEFSSSFYNEASAIVLDGTTPIVAGYVHDSAASATDFALVRFQSNGAVDPTFNGGRIVTPVAPNNKSDGATAIALQLDDRIPGVQLLAAGRAQNVNLDFAVTRYWMRVMQP